MAQKNESDGELSREMQLAWQFVEQTGTSVFLTGKAGTGKTTFLRYVKEHTSKTCVVTAPTGVAAINARGVTLHSFFQLPPTLFVPGATVKSNFRFSRNKLRIIRALDLLIIDEISMVRSDLLDAVDDTLRRLRRNPQPAPRRGSSLRRCLRPMRTSGSRRIPYSRGYRFWGRRPVCAPA